MSLCFPPLFSSFLGVIGFVAVFEGRMDIELTPVFYNQVRNATGGL